MSYFPGWVKQDSMLVMKASDDVSVAFVPDLCGTPFLANVGHANTSFPCLEDAIDWCEEVYRGMMVLLGPEPLSETDPLEAEEGSDGTRFLEERGLKA